MQNETSLPGAPEIHPKGITFVVEHTVPKASVEKFLAIENNLEAAVREASGCSAVKLEKLPSTNPDEVHYRTSMVFESQDQLVAWVDSDRRQELVHEARSDFHYDYALKVGIHSFEAWFPPKQGAPAAKMPAAWKMNLLVLLTLYPTVLALAPILRPVTGKLDFASQMLIGNTASVWITGSLLIPWANRLYDKWLRGPSTTKRNILSPLSAIGILLAVWFFCRG